MHDTRDATLCSGCRVRYAWFVARINRPLIVFVASLAFLAMVYGFAAARLGWFPSALLGPAIDYAHWSLQSPDTHRLYPARHDFTGARSYDESGKTIAVTDAANEADVTLVTSHFQTADGVRPGVRVLDRRGEVLHEWLFDAKTLWPGTRSDPMAPADPFQEFAHGTFLFENGDVLINVEYHGLVRLDSKGAVVWKIDRRTHHAVHRDEDGNFWVPVLGFAEDLGVVVEKYLGLWPPVHVEGALRISPAGEILEEHDFIAALVASEHKSLLWTTGPGAPGRRGDIVHLNDVEPLPKAIADQYPLFGAGDLVVSLCFLNAVFVYDRQTRAIKWLASGPWVRQHDPDFVGDGWISVFDNRWDESPAGQLLGGSRLVAVQPHTGAQKVLYAGSTTGDGRRRPFYTSLGGKAQRLANGGWLLTETTAGRVFEVDAEGRIRWEWVQEHERAGMVCEVLEGTRYAIARTVAMAWPKR